MLIPIDMACNDPDNGLFAGRVEQLTIGSEFLELTARRTPPRLVELPDGRLRISGRVWACHGSKEWVGNWCWNRYWLRLDVAIDMLAWLHRRQAFHCDMGETRLFNLWGKSELSEHDLGLFRRLLEKEALHIGRRAA